MIVREYERYEPVRPQPVPRPTRVVRVTRQQQPRRVNPLAFLLADDLVLLGGFLRLLRRRK